MALIPQAFIDDLIARTDIVPLIDARVPLKRQGGEYAACCPFHDEKTPSFTVSPSKQFYHCFGCGAHGTALGFLMEYDRLEFRAAVEELAKQAGMELPKDAQDAGPQVDPSLYDAMAAAAKLYQRTLRQTPAAIDYLKNRGVDGQTAKAFGIGFAPKDWQTTTQAIGNDKLAVEAGLAIRNDAGRVYDRFRGRIMFPIRDSRGRVIAMGGRAMPGDDDGPKYLNSPETPIFHKGRQLYGLYEARQADSQLESLLVVEGYMDVVSLAQFGVPNAVATLGTATTEKHLELLFRSAPTVVFCFDGDRAGRGAATRAVERALPTLRDGRTVRLLFLPDGEDPDTLVRGEGAEGFQQRLAAATPLSKFLLDQLKAEADLGSVDGRARLVELARPHLQAMPQGAFHAGFRSAIAELSGLSVEDIDAALKAAPQRRSAPPPPDDHAAPDPQALPALAGPAARACRLIIEQPGLAARLGDSFHIEPAGDATIVLLNELVETCSNAPTMTTAQLAERLRNTTSGVLVDHLLMTLRLPATLDNLEADLDDTLERVVAQTRRQRVQALLDASQQRALSTAEQAELRALYAAKAR